MILGITGGTGCGKTTLLQCIRDQGGLVLDCDAIYHQLLKTDTALLRSLENRFPGTVENGVLQRKKLGNIVFSDENSLKDLNAITHSAIKQEVVRQLSDHPSLAAIDAIALFESGLSELCDITVAVTAPEEDRIRRLMVRDGISRDYDKKRIAAQHKESWFREHCDYVLENNGNLDAFATKCLAFLRELCIIDA